jgi:hypothetical protein
MMLMSAYFAHILLLHIILDGHDSVQDAAVALELALLKATAPGQVAPVLPWGDDPVPKCSLFEALLVQVGLWFLCHQINSIYHCLLF